jgi:hypothetical protein
LQTGETGETRFLKEGLAADVMKMSASIIADRRNGRDTFFEGGSGRFVIKKSAQVVPDRRDERDTFLNEPSCAIDFQSGATRETGETRF